MKILQVHNEYRFLGGEESVVDAECTMLRNFGHEVDQWILKNSDIGKLGPVKKAKLFLSSVWSAASYQQMRFRIQQTRPDVVHVHNTIPQFTPSIYAACHSLNVPVVQTLHNYKLICPGSNLYRDNQICESCVGKAFTLPALVHGCYQHNHMSTFFAVAGLSFNRWRGTYDHNVDVYIALTEFARNKYIQGGLPSQKLMVKPNFVTTDIGLGKHEGHYALYVGRLIPQKGLITLLKAWEKLEGIPLKIVGRGVLEDHIKANLPPGVELVGPVDRSTAVELMQGAKFLVFPSEWYEGFPMVILEAFATGLPVIASRLGGMAEIIVDDESGWHFNPGDAVDLVKIVKSAWFDPSELKRRGLAARDQYERSFSANRNHDLLMDVYLKAIQSLAYHH